LRVVNRNGGEGGEQTSSEIKMDFSSASRKRIKLNHLAGEG